MAEAFAESGANLCVVSRTKDDVDRLAADLSSRYQTKVFGIHADVSQETAAEVVITEVVAALGGIDILVCAAGYPMDQQMWNKKLHELNDVDFLKVMSVDLLGSFHCAKYAIPHLVNQKSGVVLLFSSTPAVAGYDKGAPYTIAKSAVRSLAKEIALEYAKDNVRAYALAPGNIKTAATFDTLSKEEQMALSEESPMKRWGNPAEVARVAVALATDNFSFVTGQTIVVDGGTVML